MTDKVPDFEKETDSIVETLYESSEWGDINGATAASVLKLARRMFAAGMRYGASEHVTEGGVDFEYLYREADAIEKGEGT